MRVASPPDITRSGPDQLLGGRRERINALKPKQLNVCD